MGLLDGLANALGGAMQGNAAGAGGLGPLGALLGGASGGASGGQAELLRAVIGMLGNDSANGGLAGLVQQFQKAGLDREMASWVGTGANLPVSPDQVTAAMGGDQIADLARQFGLGQGDTAGALAQLLPEVVNHFTPGGQVPQGGLGSIADVLGSLMAKR